MKTNMNMKAKQRLVHTRRNHTNTQLHQVTSQHTTHQCEREAPNFGSSPITGRQIEMFAYQQLKKEGMIVTKKDKFCVGCNVILPKTGRCDSCD